MSEISRRAFVGGMSASLPVVGALGCDRVSWWDLDILHALATAILPTSLGEAGSTRIVHDFTEWADDIIAGAELNHGYGTGNIRYRTDSPVEQWADQLHDLNTAAQDLHVQNFTALDIASRRELVTAALDEHDGDNLPSAANASHVAVALLSFFANSGEGTDLAYQVSIKKQTCRPLNQSPRAPVQLPDAEA